MLSLYTGADWIVFSNYYFLNYQLNLTEVCSPRMQSLWTATVSCILCTMVARLGYLIFFWLPNTSVLEIAPSSPGLDNMNYCPFPRPEDIQPCVCKENNQFQVFLLCDIKHDMDDRLFRRLSEEFGCTKDIHAFNINMNGYSWSANLSQQFLGQFQLSSFSLTNFSFFEANIEAGAFSGSAETLTEIEIESKLDEDDDRRKYPEKFIYPSSGDGIIVKSGAFSNLMMLNSISMDGNLRRIEEDAFVNLPKLTKINLSNNKNLLNFGNIFENVKNTNLVVDLSGIMLEQLSEKTFKPFLDTVIAGNGRGYIDLAGNPLECGCDIVWFLAQYADHPSLLRNTACVRALSTWQENVPGQVIIFINHRICL